MENANIEHVSKKQVTKVAMAAALGTVIEWYDFFIYGTAAALVFNKLFFANLPPKIGTLVAFATFAVGYLARPIGAVIFGHLGDRVGRKPMLILTLIIMGVGTFIIGLLPTFASVGVWAPILLVLMRVLQGIGVGGEYGGAALLAIEYAPKDRRGFYGSWTQDGVPLGLLLASGVFSLLTLLPEHAFITWGWRVAFLSSAVLVVIGLYVRLHIDDTPAFKLVKKHQAQAKVPFVRLLKTQPKQLLQGMGIRWIEGLTFNAFAVVALTYAVDAVGSSRTMVLNGIVIGAAVGAVFTLIFGHLSDRVGRKRVYGAGVICIALFIFPSFAMMGTGSETWTWISIAIGLGVIYSAIYGPLAAFWSELFDTEVRYTGVGSVYQFSGIYASGLTPLIGAALIDVTGGKPWAFAGYMVIVAIISFLVLLTIPETCGRDLTVPLSEHSREVGRGAIVSGDRSAG